MTCEVTDEDECASPEMKLTIEEDPKGDYMILRESEVLLDGGGGSSGAQCSSSSSSSSRWWSLWWWAKLVLLLAFLGVLAAVFFKWVGPFFMDKVREKITFVYL